MILVLPHSEILCIGKFESPLAGFFLECMTHVIFDIAYDPASVDAFVAARALATQLPGATDCLHYILDRADNIDLFADDSEAEEDFDFDDEDGFDDNDDDMGK